MGTVKSTPLQSGLHSSKQSGEICPKGQYKLKSACHKASLRGCQWVFGVAQLLLRAWKCFRCVGAVTACQEEWEYQKIAQQVYLLRLTELSIFSSLWNKLHLCLRTEMCLMQSYVSETFLSYVSLIHYKLSLLPQKAPQPQGSPKPPAWISVILPSHTAKSSPSPCECGSQYLQEWDKVVLFQVITARLGQEVHKFRGIIVTGLQSPGEGKKNRWLQVAPLCSLIGFHCPASNISFEWCH